jgi:hypothetical protein
MYPDIQAMKLAWDYVLARLDIDPRDDRGLATTEIAVIAFLLVGAAIVVLGIMYAAAKNNAENIPDPQAPQAG